MAAAKLLLPRAEVELVRELGEAMRTPGLRTMGAFAEQEIVLPDGPFAGRRFRLERHPVSRLLFAELDSDRWRRAFITGPNQDGKSLLGFVIPTLYFLFERRETVILGVPNLDLVADKWKVDLLPVLEASRYRELKPRGGAGSRDGESILFQFRNGAFLRFMTGGGDDQSRAGFTSKNLLVTEADGFDRVGGNSREGTKFAQLERRTLAFADSSRTIAECTVSTEQGRTWQEIQHGTASRIAIPCPHCRAWVTPEREHFIGWADAESKEEACTKAFLVCPSCGHPWTNDERIAANRRMVLVHRGQDVLPDGTVTGPAPKTDTLGFRWTVANCVLNPRRLSIVGGIEWLAKRAADEEAAERDVRQSQWALPSKPEKVDLSALDAFAIMRRTVPKLGRGICPAGTQCVTVACDAGKWLCHWTAIAWRANATPHVMEYGRLEVPSQNMAEEDAILAALRAWRDDVVTQGWPVETADGPRIKPTFGFVDRGDWPETILRFIAESGPGWFAALGFGIGQRRSGQTKRDTGSTVVGVGEKYNVIERPDGAQYIEVNSDYWKSWWHARLRSPLNQPGSLTLFDSNEHLSWAKHQVAEKEVEEFDPREGTVKRWEAVSRNNHWLDSSMLACVAGHAAGMRLIAQQPQQSSADSEADARSGIRNPLDYRGKW